MGSRRPNEMLVMVHNVPQLSLMLHFWQLDKADYRVQANSTGLQ